jgi:SAM-dependent methyltransferase
MLKKYGNVSAMELDEFAAEYAAHTTDVDVRRGWLPDNIPYNEKFDLICMFDVLEHIQDDKKALTKIAGLLKPAGTLIITVPAYSWLYGAHDKILHHFRRYSKNTLNETINYSDLKVLKSSYFNTLLFPLIILARLTDMLKNSDESIGYSTPNSIVNHLFYRVFSIETILVIKQISPLARRLLRYAGKLNVYSGSSLSFHNQFHPFVNLIHPFL